MSETKYYIKVYERYTAHSTAACSLGMRIQFSYNCTTLILPYSFSVVKLLNVEVIATSFLDHETDVELKDWPVLS